MSDYRIASKKSNKHVLDQSKKNILIIGSANSNTQAKLILSPLNIETARQIYGENNPLFNAYKLAYETTYDTNIYTVNCPMSTDFIEIIDTIINYNFNYIVPIDIYLDDTFINPVNDKKTYFCNYYIERLGAVDSLTTLLMTDRPSYLYESIDQYLSSTKRLLKQYKDESAHILERYGSNMIFVLNNLKDTPYSNVLAAGILSINPFTKYPNSVPFKTHFDIDDFDLNNADISYFKYCENTGSCTIENLKNLRIVDDIYKWVMIDETIKHVIRKLNLDEFRGKLYSPYVKLQINTKIKKIMEGMKDIVFKQYTVESIQFVKTAPAVGYISIKVSIVPYGTLERINIVMGV
jgi:hypothetical protein